MRVFILASCVTLAACDPQGGLFSGIGSAFGNLFGGNTRPAGRRPAPQQQFQQQQQFQPQQQQFQQPQQQQFQPQQQQFQQPQQQQFQPQQTFQPQQQQFQPQPSVQSQPTFSSRPVVQAQPAAPAFRPQSIRQSAPVQSQRLTGGTSLCAAHAPNHTWVDPRDGVPRKYLLTWEFGCSSFTQSDAKAYCNSMGMEPVSLDSPAKQDEFNRLIARGAQRFFWTGGIVDHSQKTVFWSNSNRTPVPFSASAHWSNTGGAGLPQPDNRAAGEVPSTPEVCLAILNNFYADGIKWHDVACHHKKPTVCEERY